MILQCPECGARYAVPDRAIGASGRTVRCAKCSHNWHQDPTPESKAAVDELDQMLDKINISPKVEGGASHLPAIRKDRASIFLKLSAITTNAVALALLLVFIMPGLVGLPRSNGLMLSDIGIIKSTDDKHVSYQLSGKIVNTSDKAKHVPLLRVTLVDDAGVSLQYWDFPGHTTLLDPSASIPFSSGNLDIHISKGTRLVVELGNPLEMALRRKPAPTTHTSDETHS